MSLSFNTPIKALSSVGFSVGDIAVVAGAGRAIGTWLKVRYIDQALLDIVDVEDIIPRTGLIDTSALDERWSKRLILFHDGRLLPLQECEGREILKKIKLSRFTWFMTLVTAALLAATSSPCLEHVVLDVLADRCGQSEGYEYLVKDLKRNIEAWTSTARTRSIARVAERKWLELESQNAHLPGLIPDADFKELSRLILWLMGAGAGGKNSRVFHTASTDAVCLAATLQHLGIDSIRVGQPKDDFDESELAVVFDSSGIASGPPVAVPKRRGLRINLANIEEVMYLWPGDATRNNRRRDIFVAAANSTEDIVITPASTTMEESTFDSGGVEDIPHLAFGYNPPGRLAENVSSFAHTFFLAPCHQTCQALTSLISGWNMTEAQAAKELLGFVQSEEIPLLSDSMPHLSDLQTFTLGYYYGLFRSIVDTSQLSVPEAFGSWTWDDIELFSYLLRVVRLRAFYSSDSIKLTYTDTSSSRPLEGTSQHSQPGTEDQNRGNLKVRIWKRSDILRVVAYLYAGVEMKQIVSLTTPCCGLKGKLTIVNADLLGNIDSTIGLCKFVLLDIDDTIFPSNAWGVMCCGKMEKSKCVNPFEPEYCLQDSITLSTRTVDITSLIEPCWTQDLSTCIITFRREGRFVHSTDSDSVFKAVLAGAETMETWVDGGGNLRIAVESQSFRGATRVFVKLDKTKNAELQRKNALQRSQWDPTKEPVIIARLEQFDGDRVPSPRTKGFTRVCIATNGLPKVRSCVTTLCYSLTSGFLSDRCTLRGLSLCRSASKPLIVEYNGYLQYIIK
jgi:hypothetical protein